MTVAHKSKFITQNEGKNELTLKPTSALVKHSLFKHSKAQVTQPHKLMTNQKTSSFFSNDPTHTIDTSNKDINQRQVNPFGFFSINSKLMPTSIMSNKKKLENKYAEELRLRRKREFEKHYEEELANRYRPKLRRY